MFRYALKSVIRGWKKSLLFWLLIVLIALFLIGGTTLAVGMKAYSDETYASYCTIGLFEYVGDAYPDETAVSENAIHAAQALAALHLEDDPRVLTWDVPIKALGYHPAIVRSDQEVPYYESAVLLVKTGAKKGDPWYWYVTVEQELYSIRKSEGKRIKLNTNSIPLEPNHYYCVAGTYTAEGTPLLILNVRSFQNAAAAAAGFDGDIERMIVDVTTPDGGYEIPADCPLHSIAETFRVLNDGLTLTYTADIESLLPFEQESLVLTDGRFFTPQESAGGAPVCIITAWIAERLGVGVGDSLPLAVVSDPDRSYAECYWQETGFDLQQTYTIVGVTNDNADYQHHIFLPKSANTPRQGNSSYTLGVARLDNDGAEAFAAAISNQLPENVRLLLYDQGWSTVAGPMRTIRKTVVWLAVASVAAMLVLAVVFGFLFVYSDRKTARIMTRLGTNVRAVYAYFLVGAGLIALTAAIVSAGLCAVFLPRIVAALDRTLASSVVDHTLDYSNAALSFARTLQPLKPPSSALLALSGGIAVLLSVLSCILFTRAAMKQPMQRRVTVRRRTHKGNSSALTGGSFRYAVLSAMRGGARSLVPCVVTLLCTLLLLGLAGMRQSYLTQLAAIRENAEIKGMYTDLSGRRTDGLVIDAHFINALYRTGMVEDVSVSDQKTFFYVGRVVTVGNTETVESSAVESTPQSLERYADLLSGDRLIYTNHMLRHPIFGSGVPNVRWLNGYDAGIFQTNMKETVTQTVLQSGPKGLSDEPMPVERTETVAPLVVPERFLETRSVAIGDVVLFQDAAQLTKYRIVGSYHSATRINYLFCPLVYELSPDLLFSEDADASALSAYTFENAQFILKRSGDLPALKAFLLNSGYSEVRQIRKHRTFVVLYDSSFLYTTAQLEKRIASLPSFVPLVIGVGMAIAFLLVFLRRREAALMKRLGTGRLRIFLCLWLEQLMLCAVGMGLALGGFFLCVRVLPPEGVRWASLLAVGTLLCAALSAALLSAAKRSVKSKEVSNGNLNT